MTVRGWSEDALDGQALRTNLGRANDERWLAEAAATHQDVKATPLSIPATDSQRKTWIADAEATRQEILASANLA